MPYQQVRRPIATTSASNDGADGARLVNYYASQAVQPSAVVPIILRKTPGFSDGYDPNSVTARTSTNPQRMIFSVESPIYGDHLFVLSEDYLVVYESTGDDDLSEADEYYWALTPTNFTVSASKPRRWATDGRFIMIVSDTEVWAIDRKKIQEDQARTVKRGHARSTLGGNAGSGVWPAIVPPAPDDPDEQEQTENWVDVVWSDGYFVLANEAGQVWNSNLHSRQFDQLDFARADINPDPIVGMAVFQSKLFALGSQSVEIWFNAGVADGFVFQRDRSYSISVGCHSRETIQTNEDGIYFIGDDLKVYRMSGGNMAVISNDAIHETIREAVNNPDINPTITSFLYAEEGHKFYCLNVGKDGHYWCFDDRTGAWHERSTLDGEDENADEKYIVMLAHYKDKNWVATEGYKNAHIRQMGLNYGKGINGNDIKQVCVMPLLESDQKRIRHYNLQFVLEYDGDEEDDDRPEAQLSWNDKRLSKTAWKDRTAIKIDRASRVKFNRLGLAPGFGRNYRLIIESDKKKLNMLGAYITVEQLVD